MRRVKEKTGLPGGVFKGLGLSLFDYPLCGWTEPHKSQNRITSDQSATFTALKMQLRPAGDWRG